MSTIASAPNARPLSPAQIKQLSVRSNVPGLVRAVTHYGAIVAAGAMIWFVRSRYGLVWTLPLLLLQGYLVAFLFMAVHEAAHKTVFRSRRMSVILGHLSAFTIILPYEYYALFHWDHHRHTQNPERDPELLTGTIPSSDTKLAVAYTGLVQMVNRIRLLLRHAITGTVTVPWVPEGKRAMIVLEARAYVLGYLVLLTGSVAFSTAIVLWTWLVPLFVGQLFLRPYLYAEHTGCDDHTHSAYENTRTTYTGALMKWFAWNMPYHVEHHAYPSVPFHALPQLNEVIADRITHRGENYRAVTRETWSWFRRARQA